jgi:hypothetical protein
MTLGLSIAAWFGTPVKAGGGSEMGIRGRDNKCRRWETISLELTTL